MAAANSQVRRLPFVAAAGFSSTMSVLGSKGSMQISSLVSGHESR